MESRFPVVQIMQRKVVTLPKDAKVLEAAVLMRSHKIGSIVVVEGEKPVGMVTLKDIVTKVMALEKDPKKEPVGDVMCSPVVFVDKNADMNEVAKLMAKHDIRRVVVEEDGKVSGIVTDKDILSVQPAMVDVLKEFLGVYSGKSESRFKSKKGLCEICDVFDKELVLFDGRWICPQCRGDVI